MAAIGVLCAYYIQRCNTHNMRIIWVFYAHRTETMGCSPKPFVPVRAAQAFGCATQKTDVAPLAPHAGPCVASRGAAHGGDTHKCADRPGPVGARGGAGRTRVRAQRAALSGSRALLRRSQISRGFCRPSVRALMSSALGSYAASCSCVGACSWALLRL